MMKQNKMRLHISKISSHNVRKDFIIIFRKMFQIARNLFIIRR